MFRVGELELIGGESFLLAVDSVNSEVEGERFFVELESLFVSVTEDIKDKLPVELGGLVVELSVDFWVSAVGEDPEECPVVLLKECSVTLTVAETSDTEVTSGRGVKVMDFVDWTSSVELSSVVRKVRGEKDDGVMDGVV